MNSDRIYRATGILVYNVILFSILGAFLRSHFWQTIRNMTVDESVQYLLGKGLYFPVIVILIVFLAINIAVINRLKGMRG